MGLFRRRPKEPTVEQQVEMQQTSDLETQAIADPVMGAKNIADGVAFDYQVIEDENIRRIFEELDWLDELQPFFSRLNFLSNCSPDEAEQIKMSLDQAITYLKYRRKSDEEKMLLMSLKAHFNMRINDSVRGWKLTSLTTQRKILEMMRLREKKGVFRR